MANVAFHSEISAALANQAIRAASELSWTQFVLLSIIGQREVTPLPEFDLCATLKEASWNDWGLRNEITDLGFGKKEYIGGKPDKAPPIGLPTINPRFSEYELQNGGGLLYQLLWLDRIPEIDLAHIRDGLRELATASEHRDGAGDSAGQDAVN